MTKPDPLDNPLRNAASDNYAPWVAKYGLPAPYGECQCGCGQKTKIAKGMNTVRGYAKGEPVPFLLGHSGHFGRTPLKVFWKHVTPGDPDECWEWQGCGQGQGYGVFACDYRTYLAHRYSYELHVGPIPEGYEVCHKCDNPPCCNPNHLFAGTRKDNVADMIAKGRARTRVHRGESNSQAKLTEQQVHEIRQLLSDGMPKQEIANRFGVSRTSIFWIATERNWKHAKGE